MKQWKRILQLSCVLFCLCFCTSMVSALDLSEENHVSLPTQSLFYIGRITDLTVEGEWYNFTTVNVWVFDGVFHMLHVRGFPIDFHIYGPSFNGVIRQRFIFGKETYLI